MSSCNLTEKQIKAAIHADAYSYDPPNDLKQQIDARLAWQENKEVIPMKRFSTKKIAAAAALACALTGTVCMAAGKISGYVGYSSPATEITNFSDIAKLEQTADVFTGAPKAFDNGFVFANANIIHTDALDEADNVNSSFMEINIQYQKDTENIDYTVKKGIEIKTKEELAKHQAVESDGTTYYYSRSNYLFLPEGCEPTEEERAAEKAGELFISFGSSEREKKVFDGISWNANGQSHHLFGMNIDMNADDLIAMAKQLIR